MLTTRYLADLLARKLPEFADPESQILEAQGLDAIMALLSSFNSVRYPAVILEGRSSGNIQVVEGPVDSHTESIWVLLQLGNEDEEARIYEEAFQLGKRILIHLLQDKSDPHLRGWDHRRISYMKRYGGPNARGWEFVLSFAEDTSLLPD
ncbi:MAG: hypothetical protein J6O51_00860 [Bacteroidales bacterium]|nr:hypothetical protein [Bacteroidales bacterium]